MCCKDVTKFGTEREIAGAVALGRPLIQNEVAYTLVQPRDLKSVAMHRERGAWSCDTCKR